MRPTIYIPNWTGPAVQGFNPYCEWLGFEDDREPTNHYELLGVSPGERDPEVIGRAADVLIARVRRARPGSHAAIWKQLLDALAAAKTCLLDPTSRTTYDAMIRAAIGPSIPAGFPSQTALPPSMQPSPSSLQPAPPLAVVAQPRLASPTPVFPEETPKMPALTPAAAAAAQVQTAAQPSSLFAGYDSPTLVPSAAPASQPQVGFGAQTAWPAVVQASVVPEAALPQGPAVATMAAGIAPVGWSQPPMPVEASPLPIGSNASSPAATASVPTWSSSPVPLGLSTQASEPWSSGPLGASPVGGGGMSPVSPAAATQAAAMPSGAVPAFVPFTPAESFVGADQEYRSTVSSGGSLAKLALRLLMFSILVMAVLLGVLVLKQHQAERDATEAARIAAMDESAIDETIPPVGKTTGSVLPAPAGPKGKPPAALSEPSQPPGIGKRPGTPKRPPIKVQLAPISEDPLAVPAAPGTEMAQAGAQEKPGEAKQPQAPADPQKQAVLKQSLNGARAAMASRELVTAKKLVKAAGDNVQTPEDEAEVARVETLLGNLEEFWKGLGQLMGTMAVGQEMTMGNAPMIVVESGPGRMTVRSEGQNRSFTLTTIPGRMAAGLAMEGFAKQASSKVLIGTFLAMDGQGDRQQAVRLWQEAAKAGEDVNHLLAELGVAPGAVGPTKPATSSKLPVPTDAVKLQKAEETVRAKFQAAFEEATGAAGKAALAVKLIEASQKVGDPDLRYVTLREAHDLAVAAGKAAPALQAIDQMSLFYDVEPVAAKTTTLEQLVKASRMATSQREIGETALQLLGQVGAQRPQEGRRLAEVAAAAAQKSHNAMLLKRARMAVMQLQGMSAQPAPQPE